MRFSRQTVVAPAYQDLTKQEIIDKYWFEFVDWVQDARTLRSLAAPYDVYTDIRSGDISPKKVGFINENNFWLWYADYKWDKKEATERTKKRREQIQWQKNQPATP